MITQTLENTGLSAHLLEVEITEISIIQNENFAAQVLEELTLLEYIFL